MSAQSAPKVSIVMPVYNQRLSYLEEAIASARGQKHPSMELLVADNASKPEVWNAIERHLEDPRVRAVRREKNLRLFPNLNRAIREARGEWVLFLCSDDALYPDAVDRVLALADRFPEGDLYLSTTDAMDPESRPTRSRHRDFYLQITRETRALTRNEALEAVLRFGAINGNLTGMFFRRTLFERIGPFREDWDCASDYEWVARVARYGRIVLSLDPVGVLRGHEGQLSRATLRSGQTGAEVTATVRMLLEEPALRAHPRARAWARHVVQLQMWHAIRLATHGNLEAASMVFREIRTTTGLVPTTLQLIRWLPTRVRLRLTGATPIPPP